MAYGPLFSPKNTAPKKVKAQHFPPVRAPLFIQKNTGPKKAGTD